jgi:hypothetical protein
MCPLVPVLLLHPLILIISGLGMFPAVGSFAWR